MRYLLVEKQSVREALLRTLALASWVASLVKMSRIPYNSITRLRFGVMFIPEVAAA